MHPTVGQIVHYRSRTEERGACQAAIVVKAWSPDLLNLVVFDGNGLPAQRTSVQRDGGTPGPTGWHWPEIDPSLVDAISHSPTLEPVITLTVVGQHQASSGLRILNTAAPPATAVPTWPPCYTA